MNFKKLNHKIIVVYYDSKKLKEFIDLDLMNLLMKLLLKTIKLPQVNIIFFAVT